MRHLSFDFWNTLASPNPLYTRARTEFLCDITKLAPNVVSSIYTTLKHQLDSEAETGLSTPVATIHQMLVDRLVEAGGDLSSDYPITNTLFELFTMLPPLIPERLPDLLRRAYRHGHTLSVGSNTNFISGNILRQSLTDIPFSFMLFSDEIETSKPSRDFAQSICGMASHDRSYTPHYVLHIGDNLICDKMSGMEFHHVRDPQDTMEYLSSL